MLNVYEQVDINKRRSLLVIAGFVLFITAFIWLIGKILGSSPSIIIFAFFLSILSAVGSYFYGDKLVLGLSKAQPADRNKHFDFYSAAENLAIAAQIPKPDLYIIDSPSMNAFATGRNPEHAVVCATTGLINKLDKSELEGVIAHEISHIINYDIRLMTIVAVLVGTISLASNWLMRTNMGRRRSKDQEKRSPVILAAGLAGLIIAPLIAKLIQLALSRQREYFADASATKLTKQPQSLITALKKLTTDPNPLASANTATAHLYITNPLNNLKVNLFSTHPPIETRINKLQNML